MNKIISHISLELMIFILLFKWIIWYADPSHLIKQNPFILRIFNVKPTYERKSNNKLKIETWCSNTQMFEKIIISLKYAYISNIYLVAINYIVFVYSEARAWLRFFFKPCVSCESWAAHFENVLKLLPVQITEREKSRYFLEER